MIEHGCVLILDTSVHGGSSCLLSSFESPGMDRSLLGCDAPISFHLALLQPGCRHVSVHHVNVFFIPHATSNGRHIFRSAEAMAYPILDATKMYDDLDSHRYSCEHRGKFFARDPLRPSSRPPNVICVLAPKTLFLIWYALKPLSASVRQIASTHSIMCIGSRGHPCMEAGMHFLYKVWLTL